jgi:uncharacterized protein YdbL (DUF1318 family)
MKILLTLVSILVPAAALSAGCAKMQIGGTEKPIKFDISMRLDVYQHVEKDIDAIENIVSGPQKNKAADKQSFLGLFVGTAYAEEALSPDVEQAALRRKARLDALSSSEASGIVGENKSGLVEVRDPARADGRITRMVADENADRTLIYQSVARKNRTPVEEVQKLYALRLQTNAPAGTPVQNADGSWQVK